MILEINKLSHTFALGKNTVKVLENIDFSVREGEFVAIIGKSGSGKSTLLNLIAGFMKPTKGIININGTNINQLGENGMSVFRQKNLGFVFQSYNLVPTMTVFENVELPLELAGIAKKHRVEKVSEILELMDISHRENHYPKELSGGEQQRVGIARAVVANPKMVLADEPTGNLDTETEKVIINYLNTINKKFKTTLIVVTHETEIAKYADRVICIKDGRIQGYEKI